MSDIANNVEGIVNKAKKKEVCSALSKKGKLICIATQPAPIANKELTPPYTNMLVTPSDMEKRFDETKYRLDISRPITNSKLSITENIWHVAKEPRSPGPRIHARQL
jgi:hypothetical protein